MSAPSHLDWCGDPDCGDVSHKHAADAVRGSELRRHVDTAMELLGNISDLIDVPKRPEPHGWDIARLERIEAILRRLRVHEDTCAYLMAARGAMYAACDCWLADPDPAA